MRRGDPDTVSFSFVKLRRLMDVFERVGGGETLCERTVEEALTAALAVGAAALPPCIRELIGAAELRGALAEHVLARLLTYPSVRPRLFALLPPLAAPEPLAALSEGARDRVRRLLCDMRGTLEPDLDFGRDDRDRDRDDRDRNDRDRDHREPDAGASADPGMGRDLDDDRDADDRAANPSVGPELGADRSERPGVVPPHPLTRRRAGGQGAGGGLPALSLAALIDDLSSPAAYALAADRMLRELMSAELIELIEQLVEHDRGGAERAYWLTGELLLRTELDGPTCSALRRIRAPLVQPAKPRWAGRVTPPARLYVGRHPHGRAVVVASQRCPQRSALATADDLARLRVVCLLLAADGTLIDGMYGDDFSPRLLKRELLGPLGRRRYRFATAPTPAAVAQLVSEAARAAVARGRPLPRAFYLGRDVLGIYDQHSARLVAAADDTPLLERGLQFLAEGAPERAGPVLERYVKRVPQRAEGQAALARCLLAQGDLEGARTHLLRAVALDPDNPLHQWNLSSVAHRQGRSGGCYLALLDYLDLVGDGAFDAGAGSCDERVALAERFVAEFERLAAVEHPGAAAADVARADDLAFQGRRRLEAGRCQPAIALLEQAVSLLPGHALAWTWLGQARHRHGDRDEACGCLQRALRLRPGYPDAVRALADLEA